MVPFSLRRATGVLLVLAGLSPLAVLAQVPPPGRAHLFVLDLSGTPVGEFPTTIKQLKGSLEVALKDGVPMLKASVTSEFLITLPQGQVLPPDFTLEFDLVPKGCCNPSDLSFEGTPTINQGAGSAHVLWDSDGYLAIVGGGGDTYEAPMFNDLLTLIPGVLTRVVAVVQGPTIRLYTNGRRHFTLDKQFVRGRVLRVTLGVDLARQDPIYLAGLRILAGAFPPTAIAVNPAPPPGQPGPPVGTLVGGVTKPPGKVVGGSASQSQASTGGSVPTTVSNVSVTQGTAGPVVSWQPVSVAAAYLVRRWKIDDLTCCNNASPASAPLAGPPWQDAPLPVGGTYVYEVTATMSGGVASGQAQFVQLRTAGSIASTLPTATAASAPIIFNAPSGPAVTTVPRTGTLPPTLSVTAVAAPPPLVEYVRVTWTPLAVSHVISVRRWKSDDPNCCNLSSGNIGGAIAFGDPLLQNGVLPGTYFYEVTATTSTATIVGQTQFTVQPPALPTAAGTISPAAPAPPAPAPAPTVTAPIAGTPRAGGTSTLAFGPATLSSTARQGWGVRLQWPEVVNARSYHVERGVTNQNLVEVATIMPANQPAVAGNFSMEDVTVLPASVTFYRVKVTFLDGTSAYSPLARYDAPAQVPYVSNLTILQVFSGPLTGLSGYRGMRWGWAAVTGALGYAIQTDIFARDPTGAMTPVSGGIKRTSSSRNLYEDDFKVTSGNSVRFCISLVFPVSQTDPLQHAVCQMTDIP